MANPFQSILPGMKTSGGSDGSTPATDVRKISMSVPSFKKGTKYVPKTGAAKVHKGEAILSKGSAKKYRKTSNAARTLGAGKDKKQKLIQAAGHEMKVNPPKILAKTAKKEGAEAAGKQKIAIMLSKARAAGADIPEK